LQNPPPEAVAIYDIFYIRQGSFLWSVCFIGALSYKATNIAYLHLLKDCAGIYVVINKLF